MPLAGEWRGSHLEGGVSENGFDEFSLNIVTPSKIRIFIRSNRGTNRISVAVTSMAIALTVI